MEEKKMNMKKQRQEPFRMRKKQIINGQYHKTNRERKKNVVGFKFQINLIELKY